MKHMNTYALTLRRPAGAVAALVVAAGLVLAGCGTGGSGSPGTAGSSGSGSQSAGTGSGSSGGSTSVVSSGSVPFPIAVGNTWKYNDTSGKTVDKIVSVTSVSGGQQVRMVSAITVLGITSHSTGYFIFHPDGSISYPFSQFSSGSTSTRVTLLSGNVIWPSASQLASGQVAHDTLKIEFITNGVKHDVTAHITVKGDGTQSVSVPAGSYSATVVDMTESETIEGIAVSSEVKTWLANGVGPVKSEVIVSEGGHKGTVADVNQLTSFTKG
jgi:hypothetical protein